MSANAIEILRLGGTWIPRNRRIDIEYNDALAAVEAEHEVARDVRDWLQTVGAEEGNPVFDLYARLDAAVRRVETGQ